MESNECLKCLLTKPPPSVNVSDRNVGQSQRNCRLDKNELDINFLLTHIEDDNLSSDDSEVEDNGIE